MDYSTNTTGTHTILDRSPNSVFVGFKILDDKLNLPKSASKCSISIFSNWNWIKIYITCHSTSWVCWWLRACAARPRWGCFINVNFLDKKWNFVSLNLNLFTIPCLPCISFYIHVPWIVIFKYLYRSAILLLK